MRVLTDVVVGRSMQIRKIASTPTRNSYFFTNFAGVLYKECFFTAFACANCSHQSGCASADDNNVVLRIKAFHEMEAYVTKCELSNGNRIPTFSHCQLTIYAAFLYPCWIQHFTESSFMRVVLVLFLGFLVTACSIPTKEKEIHNIEWSEVDKLTSSLADTCKNQPNPWKGILIISRGGLVPGGILAQKLGIKNVRVICLASYKDKTRGELQVLHRPDDIEAKGKDWIIIDDLADSGATLRYVKGFYPDAYYVTLITKPQGRGLSTSATEYPQDTWIAFPWEK